MYSYSYKNNYLSITLKSKVHNARGWEMIQPCKENENENESESESVVGKQDGMLCPELRNGDGR